MKNNLIIPFALLFIACDTPRPQQTYDEMLNDVVQNFNVGTVGGDSVLNVFVQKAQADSIARKYSNPAMKEEMMFDLISEYLQAGQTDNAQQLYDNMLEYAEQKYGKICPMKAMVYFEKAHIYELTGDLENAIKMMQKSAAMFEQLPKQQPVRTVLKQIKLVKKHLTDYRTDSAKWLVYPAPYKPNSLLVKINPFTGLKKY